MELFLYSGFSTDNPLDEALRESINNGSKDFTILPTNPNTVHENHLFDLYKYFSKIGFNDFRVCIYTENKEKESEIISKRPEVKVVSIDKALESSTLFLSGGNNYAFLNNLRETGLFDKVRGYAQNAGRLVGMSAGSMVMNPDISHTSIPDYDLEENEVGIKDLSALDLVDFYIFPHFDDKQEYIDQAKAFVQSRNGKGYLLRDNTGVYFGKSGLSLCGDVVEIE